MIDRCESIKSDQFANYGGRGILVCREWRERLWLSPHCLGKVATAQLSLLA